jgi:lipoate-protein ligase A
LAAHGSDLSCSVVLPHESPLGLHEAMRRICAAFQAACAELGGAVAWRDEAAEPGPVAYCLAQPSSYALLSGGRKLMGFAMRRYPGAWLIQGSLLVRPILRRMRAMMPRDVGALFDARAVSLEEAAGCAVTDALLIHAVTDGWSAAWSSDAL